MFNNAGFRTNGTQPSPETHTAGSAAPVLPKIQVAPEFRIPMRAADAQQHEAHGSASPLIPLRTAVAPAAAANAPRQAAAATLQTAVNALTTQGKLTAIQSATLNKIINDPAVGVSRLKFITEALGHMGKPYNWGSTGPSQFDCSGLTSSCMKNELGIAIPRTAAYQAKDGKAVSRDALKAGDLLFFGGRRITHTAIYLGDGLMLEAGGEGRVRNNKGSVRIRPIRGDFKSARQYISDKPDQSSLQPKQSVASSLWRGIFDRRPVQSIFDWFVK